MHYTHRELDFAATSEPSSPQNKLNLEQTAEINYRSFVSGQLKGAQASDLAVWMLTRHEPEAASVALHLLRRLADAGLTAAMYNLAVEKYTGAHVERDRAGAVQLFKTVVDTERDDMKLLSYATAALGFAFLHRGNDEDARRALALFVEAADLGHELAAYTAALIFHGKIECLLQDDIDYAKAAHFYQIAADHGNSVAQASLGRLIATGIVPGTDPEYGRHLALAAGMNGDVLAEGVLVDLLTCSITTA